MFAKVKYAVLLTHPVPTQVKGGCAIIVGRLGQDIASGAWSPGGLSALYLLR